VRDSLRLRPLPPDPSRQVLVPIGGENTLLARLDIPRLSCGPPRALVIVVPGLGGCAEGAGPRRLALALQGAGFATFRLNLRGAGEGRSLAGGSYAARCDHDLLSALQRAREVADGLADGRVARLPGARCGPVPLAAVGISLGGTILLNALRATGGEPLAALACISSPLDLPACTRQFERPRNAFYQRWLVRRLRSQILADRRGLGEAERQALLAASRPRTIRTFDAAITAPRWGYRSVEAYYADASPWESLRRRAAGQAPGPPTLLLHAADDPWVPVDPALELVERLRLGVAAGLEVLVTDRGGHCGFHGAGDSTLACWSDRLIVAWLGERLAEPA
jgi:predicted alpha/beta-fold hydrolase